MSSHPHGNGSSRSASRTRHGGAFKVERPGSTGTSFMQLQQCGPRASASGGRDGEGGGGVHATDRKREQFTSASSLSPCSCRNRPLLQRWGFCPLLLQGCPPPGVCLPLSAPSPVRSAGRAPRLLFEPSVGSAVLAAHPWPHIGRASRSPPLTSEVSAHPVTVITILNHGHGWNTRRSPRRCF